MTEHINDHSGEGVDAEVVVEPILDADDARDVPTDETLAAAKQNARDLGDTILGAASTAAYATIGLVGVASDRIKEYYEDQKQAYTAAHPDEAETSSAHKVMFRIREQLDEFVGDVSRLVRDLADRGRVGAERFPARAADVAEAASGKVADTVQEAAAAASDKAADTAGKAAAAADEAADRIREAGAQFGDDLRSEEPREQ